jgi:hypothetical protein
LLAIIYFLQGAPRASQISVPRRRPRAEVGSARRAERGAGGDDNALARFREAFLVGDLVRAIDDIVEIVRVFGQDAVQSPRDAKSPRCFHARRER